MDSPSHKDARTSNYPKSVSFCDTVIVHEIPHILDYTAVEKKASWFSKSELSAIQFEARAKVTTFLREFRLGKRTETCERGLERFAAKDVRVYQSRLALLSLQKSQLRKVFEQKNSNHFDESRTTYLQHSQTASSRAYLVGTQDAEDAHQIFLELLAATALKDRGIHEHIAPVLTDKNHSS